MLFRIVRDSKPLVRPFAFVYEFAFLETHLPDLRLPAQMSPMHTDLLGEGASRSPLFHVAPQAWTYAKHRVLLAAGFGCSDRQDDWSSDS